MPRQYTVLDRSKIPADLPTMQKSVMWRGQDEGGWIFGTLLTTGLSQLPMEIVNDAGGLVMSGPRINLAGQKLYSELTKLQRPKGLPSGWSVRKWLYDEEEHVANFLGYCLCAPHNLKLFECGGGIPPEVGYLLSGFLQLGEDINIRNFKKYVTGRNMKFLPFVICPKEFRFYVYEPTPERIQGAVETFKRILADLEDTTKKNFQYLKDVVRMAYARVRIDEALHVCPTESYSYCMKSDELAISKRLLLGDIFELLGSSGSLSYVYQGTRGQQTVTQFSYEMYQKKIVVDN